MTDKTVPIMELICWEAEEAWDHVRNVQIVMRHYNTYCISVKNKGCSHLQLLHDMFIAQGLKDTFQQTSKYVATTNT